MRMLKPHAVLTITYAMACANTLGPKVLPIQLLLHACTFQHIDTNFNITPAPNHGQNLQVLPTRAIVFGVTFGSQ